MGSRLSSLVVLASVVASCSSRTRGEIQAEFDAFVERNNACTQADECVVVYPGCPLGCFVAVNETRADATRDKASALVDEYESGGQACAYDCMAPGAPRCESGHCRVGPSEGCTLIGCGPAFSVRFDKASSFPTGTYQVAVTLDGAHVDCTVTLPLSCGTSAVCTSPAVSLLLEGCALPPSEHALGGIELPLITPATVSIIVQHDGQTIAQGQWSPVYETSHPNGPSCEPECRSAPAEALAIP